MSLDIDDLISTSRNLLEEEQPSYWTNPMMIQYVNLALEWAYMDCAMINEFFGITKTTITVTAGTLAKDLPDGTIFVSDYHDDCLVIDFRPYISESSRLILERDYYIANDQFNFHTTDTADRVVVLYVKKLPTAVTDPTGQIALGRYWRGLMIELIVFFARRRDENIQPENNMMINAMRKQVKKTINRISGSLRNYQVRWDLPD